MDPKQTEFGQQAFGEQSEPLVTVKYESQQHALDFIWSVIGDGSAVGLIEGPAGSGKSTVISQFVSELPRDAAVAAIDGTRIKPRESAISR
jgi:ABC-type phosphate/phosphonate transport system ATPase subunit